MKYSILVVEDELSIQRILQYELKNAGFEVEIAEDGQKGFDLACCYPYDVILLDGMLPKMDGFEVCKSLRERKIPTYIVMLSARDDEFDRINGLECGADDYMTKPFSSRELVTKIKAIIRRREVLANETFEKLIPYGELILDTNKYEVRHDGKVIEFTLKEFELLLYLIKHPDQVLSRDVLLDRLWGYEYDGDTRIVDVHIFKLREKLKTFPFKVKTIRGVGYMLEAVE